jgi:hypothetical protein
MRKPGDADPYRRATHTIASPQTNYPCTVGEQAFRLITDIQTKPGKSKHGRIFFSISWKK